MKEITLNGIVYVPKSEVEEAKAKQLDGMDYVIIRTYSAGVHTGYLEERNGKEVILRNSRRLWKWAGAFTLSELAKSGTTKPNDCKFTTKIDKILLTEAIEVIPCTEKARISIESVADYQC
jgi:hypothetical protein|nr:MAG TPA: hypothetical protein [Caudoviricetes sp.]